PLQAVGADRTADRVPARALERHVRRDRAAQAGRRGGAHGAYARRFPGGTDAHGDRSVSHRRSRYRVHPELGAFAEHNAGAMILASLAIAGESDDSMPPSKPIRISISELARRFSVSRAHVLRLLREVEAQGLIERSGAETITLKPPL